MNRYKLELWSYHKGACMIPTIVDTHKQWAVCEMKCDGGRTNPYTSTLAEAEKLASRIVEFLNSQPDVD